MWIITNVEIGIFHLNNLVNSNLIWTCNEFCCTIHHFHHIMEYLAELSFIHSDFSLTPLITNDLSLNYKNFCCFCKYVNSLLIVKNSNTRRPTACLPARWGSAQWPSLNSPWGRETLKWTSLNRSRGFQVNKFEQVCDRGVSNWTSLERSGYPISWDPPLPPTVNRQTRLKTLHGYYDDISVSCEHSFIVNVKAGVNITS